MIELIRHGTRGSEAWQQRAEEQGLPTRVLDAAAAACRCTADKAVTATIGCENKRPELQYTAPVPDRLQSHPSSWILIRRRLYDWNKN